MRATLLWGTLACLGALGGCASLTPAKIVGEPSEVTVEEALTSVGEGLRAMRVSIGENKTGLVPAEVIVTFKLAASATEEGKLTIDLAVPAAPVGGAASGSARADAGRTAEGSRSNEITVRFVNVLLLPKDTLATARDAREIGELLEVLQKSGISPLLADEPADGPK